MARAVFYRLPVFPDVPLPSIAELGRHIAREHMRPLELIDRLEADERAMAAAVIVTEAGVFPGSIIARPANPPSPPKKPKHKDRNPWSERAMAARYRRTGWTPEMQISLREAQGNTCAWCHNGPPKHMDVSYTDLPDGTKRVTVYGFICDYCHLITQRTHRDRAHLLAGIAYWDNPPARLVS